MAGLKNKFKTLVHRFTGSFAVKLHMDELEVKAQAQRLAETEKINAHADELEAKTQAHISTEAEKVSAHINELEAKIDLLSKFTPPPPPKIEDLSDLDKQKVFRTVQVKQINAAANNKVKLAYGDDNYFLNHTTLNEEDDIPLSPDELKEINDFWEPYSFAYKNNPEIQRLFYRMSGRFDPSYISWGLNYFVLTPFWETKIVRNLSFKHNTAWFFPDLPAPRTYVLCEWGGRYFDEAHDQISKDKAVDICYDVLNSGKDILLKPSDGVCGKGISIIRSGVSKEEICEIFDEHKDRFLCQQVIKNHPSYEVSKSLNTLRIVTFIYKDEVHWIGTMLRMGVSSDVVDNWGSGGIACPVSEDGICGNFAISKTGQRVYKHPNGFEFAGHKLYNYDKAQKLAMDLHKKLPMVNFLSWDIAVNEDGEPLVIEFGNPGLTSFFETGGFNTYLNKDIVKEILDEYLIKRFFYSKATFDWNFNEYKDHIVLTKYCGFDSEVKVPERINGKNVTFVCKSAINKPIISTVCVPESVKLDNGAVAGDINIITV